MYYFFLGNTPELSLLELKSLYSGSFSKLKSEIYTTVSEIELGRLDRLGGTRKVAVFLKDVEPKDLLSELTAIITADPAKNVAVTDYASTDLSSAEIISIKKSVHAVRPIRFVSTETSEHELLMLSHQHVSEFNLLPGVAGQIVIAKTIWIYDAESWVDRDRKKPYRDIKRGMLPPKLARIMVNLACQGQNLTIYDPFCGTGTVLTEAMLEGSKVVGSDNDRVAVEGASKNCEWLNKTYGLNNDFILYVSDVTHPDQKIKDIQAIVTEPYMGPLVEDRYIPPFEKLKNIGRGLDKLYRGAFSAWADILKPGARVVISIPKFVAHNRTVETISIDTLRALGYNYIDSVAYGKPGAVVIRNITILEKQ